MLAMIWSPRQILPKTGGSIFETLGWAGLLALMLLYNRLNEFQPFLYWGGIIVVALASALLVVGASTPTTRDPHRRFDHSGATPMIQDLFGENIYIDAARKRKMEDVPAPRHSPGRDIFRMLSSFTWAATAHLKCLFSITGWKASRTGSEAYVNAIQEKLGRDP
jgi:hypothetical protein